MARSSHASGKSLETVIESSQRVIRIDKMQAAAIWKKDGTIRPGKGPVDFVGQVLATGRAIRFDAKRTSYAPGLKLGMLKPHQRDSIDRHGKANAITGVLAECYAPGVQQYFWIPAAVVNKCVRDQVSVIRWEIKGITAIGSTLYTVQFQNIPAVATEIEIAEQVAALRRAANEKRGRDANDPDQLPLFRADFNAGGPRPVPPRPDAGEG